MSADNGIYIGKFSDGYRVIEASAIDNVYYSPQDGFDYSHGNPRMIVDYFDDSEPVNEETARKSAFGMYEEIMKSGFPVCEYGISLLVFDKPFQWYVEKEKEQPE